MKKFYLLLFFASILQFTWSSLLQACTEFFLKAKDGSLLITRSMEFAEDLHSNLRTSQRGRIFKTLAPNGKPGLNWKAKYGYLYLDGFGVDASFDGMNEEGLSFGYLYLPGETQYQTMPVGEENKALPYFMFGDWILSRFKTIEEVKTELDNIYVVQALMPNLGNVVLPAHASIFDRSGQGMVVEFYDNKIHVSKHIGIMTNSPRYEWHVTNLRNYLNLSSINAKPILQNGNLFASTGQGSGAVGLPGDASPPSRFVKTAFMVQNVEAVADSKRLLNLAEHLINNVDLPRGYVKSIENGKTVSDFTQWVVFKDLSQKILHYRTYDDMTLRAIQMSKLKFEKGATPSKIPLDTPK